MVTVETVRTSEEADAALDLATRVWGAPPISEPMLRALEFAGCYLAVARDGTELVGMCAGFVGLHDHDLHLHSHLAAVVPGRRRAGIGRALKWHQRAWCLDHGIETVTWTFDPLVRENARFNLHHLGAAGDRYLIDLYGPMDDAINRGDPTDRLLVRWDLRGDRTGAAERGPLPVADAAELRGAGAIDVVLPAASPGDRGQVHRPTDAPVRLVATPDDIVGLRSRSPELALRWRTSVRAAMVAAFAAGLVPVAMTDDHCYVFRDPGLEKLR